MLRLRVILLTLGLATLATQYPRQAHAATLGLDLYSHHTSGRTYESNNPGVYVVLDNGFGAGVLRNSLGQTSVHVDYTMCGGSASDLVQPCVTAGAITGYQMIDNQNVRPMVVPSLRIGFVRLSGVASRRCVGVHFSLEKQL